VSEAFAVPDVRTRILEEATRLFASRGYDGTSIQEIALAVGITRPTLVYHYGSKEQLRNEVLATMLSRWRDELPRVLAAATTGSDRFRSALDALISWFRAEPHRARLLVREMLDRPDEMIALFRAHLQPWTSLITDYVRRGQAEGRVRPGVDPEAYVLQILTAVIATVATGSATRHVVADAPDLDRQLAELHRVARTSLFNERQR
jgi:TetR/AcrR family transcriptional regulator